MIRRRQRDKSPVDAQHRGIDELVEHDLIELGTSRLERPRSSTVSRMVEREIDLENSNDLASTLREADRTPIVDVGERASAGGPR